MGKKKIFIYHYSMELGGIEKSLLGLLRCIDYSKNDVTLFLMKYEGDLLEDIPNDVHIILGGDNAKILGVPIGKLFKEKKIRFAILRTYASIKLKIKKAMGIKSSGEEISQIVYPKLVKRLKKQTEEYDIAIGFSWPHYYILNNVKAKLKIGWVHTDYSKIYPNIRKDQKMWEQLDKIACVSEECKNTFVRKFPSIEINTIVIENILDYEYLEDRAKEKINEKTLFSQVSSKTLLSVGRFCEAKNFDNVPAICCKILEQGEDIKWYLIGFGPDEALIREKIRQEGMEEKVIILGKKENPYPYMKACDLYVQPSRFEGKAVTVREAQMLGKPVVITNFESAKSQVEDGVDGIIVPMDVESCAKEIVRVLQDKKLCERLSETCRNRDYSNGGEIDKIYRLMK